MTDLFLDPSDAELLQRYRDGDDDAAGLLFERHHPSAVRLAGALAGASAAEDLASDAFVAVLQAVRNGAGPQFAFRPYLLTSVRNGFYAASKADGRRDLYGDLEAVPTVPTVDDGTALREESSLLAQAFATLPERWQAVLWHTTIHGESPDQMAQTLGIKPSAVSSLALRAREGLRNAYLTAHLGQTDAPECRKVRALLPAYDRGRLRARQLGVVEAHLEGCDECREAAAMVGGITANLGLLLLPALLGAPGVAAFGATGTGVGAAATAATAGTTAAGTSGGSSSGAGAASGAGVLGGAGAVAAAAALVAVVTVAAVGAALVTRGNDDTTTASPRTKTSEPVEKTPTGPTRPSEPTTPSEPVEETPLEETPTDPTPAPDPTSLPDPVEGPTSPTPSEKPRPTPSPSEPVEEPSEPTPTTMPSEPVEEPDEDLSIHLVQTTSTLLWREVVVAVSALTVAPEVRAVLSADALWWADGAGWTCRIDSAAVVCRASSPAPGPLRFWWSPPHLTGFSASLSAPEHTDPSPENNTVAVD